MATIRHYFRPEQLREFSLVFLILAIFLFFGSQIQGYFSVRIFNRVTSDVAIIGVVAMGETLVLLTRNYDLSVGSIVGVTAFFIGKVVSANTGLPPIVALLLAVGTGTLMGMLNGLIISYGRVPSLIATLGTLAIYRSALVAWPSDKIVVAHLLPPWVLNLASESLFSVVGFFVTPLLVIALVVLVVFHLVTTYLPYGRRLYAIGSNPEAARIGGLPVERTVFIAFTLSGALSGLAGLMFLVRYGDLTVGAAQGMELEVIAAAVVGGVGAFGGYGTMIGALLGAFMIDLLDLSLLRWLQISDFWVSAFLGAMILLAVTVDSVIVSRLRDIWAKTEMEMPPDGKKTLVVKEESHGA
jgi:rhamnose transport system permease protein